MRVLMLLCSSAIAILAQSTVQQPIVSQAGYSFPVPLSVAPGQLITLFVQGVNTQLTAPVRATTTPLPTMLAGVSVNYHQGTDQAGAMLEVRPISTCLGIPPPSGSTCGTILAVTVQLPFQMLTLCPLCARPDIPASIAVTVNGVTGLSISAQPLNDQVHFLTTCDVMMPGSQNRINIPPCAPMVTHADGKLVSATSPAQSGEELVAYAAGLGQTDPPMSVGQSAPNALATTTSFAIDFNYHPNALAAKPGSFATPAPVFSGATAGFVGLYQINFIVPPAPPALPHCDNSIQSNLTVSVGSPFSFDGAAICVQPES